MGNIGQFRDTFENGRSHRNGDSVFLRVSRSNAILGAVQFSVLAILYPQVHAYFAYMKFGYNPLGLGALVAFGFLATVLGWISVGMAARLNNIITTTPTLVLAAFQVVDPVVSLITVLLQIYIALLDRDLPFPRLSSINLRSAKLMLMGVGILALLVLVYFRNLISFENLLDVYGNRAAYVQQLSGGVGLTYAKTVVKILLVGLAIMAMKDKSWGIVAIVASVLFYSIMSSKFMLLIPVLVWLFPKVIMDSRYTIAFFMILLTAVGLAFVIDEKTHLIIVSLTRRAFLLVPRLNDIYYEIYLETGAQYFVNSFLSGLAGNQDQVPIARLASIGLWGDTRANANAATIGSGIVQLGPIGPFIYATIYLLLANLNSGYRSKDPVSLAALSIFMLTAFGISDISTTLVLHGGLFFTLIFRVTSETLFQNKFDSKSASGGQYR